MEKDKLKPVAITIRLSPEDLKRLDEQAAESRRSRSQLVARYIDLSAKTASKGTT